MRRTQKEIAKDNFLEIGFCFFCNQEDVGMDTGQRCVGCLWMRRKRNFKQGPLPTTYKNLGDVFVLILSVKHEDKQKQYSCCCLKIASKAINLVRVGVGREVAAKPQ